MNAGQFEGKVALITGAGRGLGRELVASFAEAGASVAFCARRPVDELAKSIGAKALGMSGDVGRPEDVERLVATTVERFGRIDILINNVGIAGPTASIEETSLEAWEETIRVNLTGTFLCTKAVVPRMKRQNSGAIINIGSVTGKRPLSFRTPYAASKAALIGMTRTLAEELGPAGIRVNLVSPGAIEGERLDEILKAQAQARGVDAATIRKQFSSLSPLNRLVSAADVVDMCLFLASDRAKAITGQDLNVAAGVVMY